MLAAQNKGEHSAADLLRTEQEHIWRNRQLTAFYRVSEVILSGKAEREACNIIAREIGESTGFPIVTIEKCDFRRAVMIHLGVHGFEPGSMSVPFEVPMDATLSGLVARKGKTLVVSNLEALREHSAPVLRKLDLKTFLCSPIKADGRIIGTLSLGHLDRISIDPQVILQVSSLANYLVSLFDRLQAREEVHRREAELAAVYDGAPCVMCLFDEQLRIVRANRAAAELAGCTKEKLTSLPVGNFLGCSNCDPSSGGCTMAEGCSDCEIRRAVTETLHTGESWRQVRTNKTINRSGQQTQAVFLISTERMEVEGAVRVLMCLEDVTRNVRADEQIRSQAALLDVTRDAIYVRDFSDRIIYWNEGAQQLYGWSMVEVRNKTVNEILSTGKPDDSSKALAEVQKKEEWIGELWQKTREGRILTVQSRWTLVRDSSGKPKAILVVNSDITEKKRLESQLLRSQRLESIGTLASGIAHDLNNVLAPIMMAVDFLKEDATTEEMRTWVQTLETCSQRGAGIVRQVLTFARGIEGARVLVNPKHLIEEIVRIVGEIFPRSIEIHSQFCKSAGVVLGDATQIQQVLMNLCVNARDAMPQGGTLSLSLDSTEVGDDAALLDPKARSGTYLVISVSDTGTGIPSELMDKIFDPFFTTKPPGQGTGLGLPTVLGIVESHGGFIRVESQVGKGTTLQVYLPAAPAGQDDTDTKIEPARLRRGKGEQVLVVDDEPAVRRMTGIILTKNGYRPLLAAEGNEALALFERNRNDVKLVVSDLMMPHLDGPATIRALRKIQPDLPSITITGLGEESRIAEAREAGTDIVLHKPFTAEQLLAAVKQLLP